MGEAVINSIHNHPLVARLHFGPSGKRSIYSRKPRSASAGDSFLSQKSLPSLITLNKAEALSPSNSKWHYLLWATKRPPRRNFFSDGSGAEKKVRTFHRISRGGYLTTKTPPPGWSIASVVIVDSGELQRRTGGHLLENNKPHQLDPSPAVGAEAAEMKNITSAFPTDHCLTQ